MGVGLTYFCEGPDCEIHVGPIATPRPYIPMGWIVTQEHAAQLYEQVFCSWDCVLRYAAKMEPLEVIDGPGL